MTRANYSKPEAEGTLRSYVTGFILSLGLTLAAYFIVVNHSFSMSAIIAWIVALALAQFLVQMLFFLHLGREKKPRWKLYVALYMVMVVTILVLGSLWIMSNLNYRMTPAQINSYLNSQSGL